jgi:hypothetical protein
MGLSAAAAGDGAQLCVFDLRRGQQEGQELDKILFFHPADCPILLQLSVIGLCEGIVTFTRSPSPPSLADASRLLHYSSESSIWRPSTCFLVMFLKVSLREFALTIVE